MENVKDRIPLSIFSAQRQLLMGFATAAILLIHSNLFFEIHNAVRTTWDLLFGAVDVFLFLSGLGLYYSFYKNKNLSLFYLHRFMRIIPQFLIVSVFWLVLHNSLITIKDFCGDVFLLRFWTTGARRYWFISLIFVLYLAYPIVHFIYERYQKPGFLVLLTGVIVFTVWASHYLENYSDYEIALTRVPSFLLGAWVGKCSKEERRISRKSIWISLAVVTALWIACYYGIIGIVTTLPYRYSCALFCICFSYLLAILFSKFTLINIKIFFAWLGSYSLECYLIHEKIIHFIEPHFGVGLYYGIVQSIIGLVISLVLAVCLKHFCSNLMSEFSALRKNLKSKEEQYITR